jgi:hypothetical protein
MAWIGVDLDGTLAEYHGWVSSHDIGVPIPKMVARVKKWLGEGKEVRIFTARVSANPHSPAELQRAEDARTAIVEWCKLHIGMELVVTNVKDLAMTVLYDDRCRQVLENSGVIVGEQD